MPKSKRLPGGKEFVGAAADEKATLDPDIEDIDFSEDETPDPPPAEEVGQDITEKEAQERRDAMKAKTPATKPRSPAEYEGTLYVERRRVFRAEPFGDEPGMVSVTDDLGESEAISQEEFDARFEALDSTPKTPRWKIQITSPDKVPRSLWGASGPDPAKIYKYVEKNYDAEKENPIPMIPGVMVSGPAH